MNKIEYGMYGVVERYTAFRFGKANFRVVFEGGSIGKSGVIPATYTTSNPIIQQAIENSDLFKKNIVEIVSKVEITDSGKSDNITLQGIDGQSDEKDYPDVVNGQMARTVLSGDPYNVPMAKLTNNAGIKQVAAEFNVTFSNWN